MMDDCMRWRSSLRAASSLALSFFQTARIIARSSLPIENPFIQEGCRRLIISISSSADAGGTREMLRELATGNELNIGNVADFAFDPDAAVHLFHGAATRGGGRARCKPVDRDGRARPSRA